MRIKSLKDVQKYLNGIDCINYGGCGISLISMYRWLKKENKLNGKERFVFMYSNSQKYRYDSNKNVDLKNNSDKVYSPTHCVLFHKRKYLDSDGDFILKHHFYSLIQKVKEEGFLIQSLMDKDQWNHDFDWDNVHKIERKLGIDLSDIKLGVGI